MKKIFVIIASVVMSLVVIMVIVMSLVKVNVKIDYDGDPKQIYIYNQSTDAISHTSGGSKINYFTKENEEYSEILSYLNKATNISVFERLLNNSTLKNEVEQDFDGTYTKWSTELKKKNIVIELVYDSKQRDSVVYYKGDSKVISYYTLAFVIPVGGGVRDVVVYFSSTNDTTRKEVEYTQNKPIHFKIKADKLIKYVKSM